MSIAVSLHHRTVYQYDRPVLLGPHIVRLRPAPHCRTPIRAYSLKVDPERQFLNWQQDPFGNYQARLVFPKEADALTIDVDLIAEMTVINPFDFFIEEQAEKFPFVYDERQRVELLPYLQVGAGGAKLEALQATLAREVCRAGRRTIDVLVDINQHVQRLLRYDVRMEPGVFTPEETLARGHGSCRDFAWLLAQLMRRLKFAARFVSGYSIQLKADLTPLDGPAGVTSDVTDLHAWTEVFLPGAGWIGFDPTSGMMCGEGHIPLACTADPDSAAPVTGGYSWTKVGGDDDRVHESFSFEMRAARLDEQPRVTKPYTEEQWGAINTLGQQVDLRLRADDVRLSMGGEPTFVSIDDPEGAEWSTAALGDAKKRLSEELVLRLKKRFAPGGLLFFGQGKWYPGEPLPRWAMTCYFRKDGVPISRGLAVAGNAAARPSDVSDARALVLALAEALGVDGARALPAYEDTFYYLWRERRLPVNVDLADPRLDDAQERARLARVFGQGVGAVVGYVLPLAHTEGTASVGETPAAGSGQWRTGPWPFRGERLFLIPGDSPLGYRLPIDSLPWVAPEDRVVFHEPDQLARRPPLRKPVPGAAAARVASSVVAANGTKKAAAPGGLASGAPAGPIGTALCIEPRGGLLHVFLPPLESLEAFLELAAVIEQAAAGLNLTVRLEGYPAPRDPRLGNFAVTPDPGVIEVNIHPSLSWDELVANTSTLYEEARLTRLGTEKFMLDGRHTGTGGGNHVVLGGPTPADSPLLRRPDLLRSFVAYFINHPSLSYLFSGMFVGPTSQAPRADEARQETVDELEIAFAQIDDVRPDAPVPPWLVDRVFRNLLVDVTGNTHRAELCIDKLYSPDSASGRLGLLELRAFEMPPHSRMSLAQQLLLRGLVSMFWRTPYRRRPVRWGTALHDRFMLPHFLWEDLGEILDDLQSQAGFAFSRDWYVPHLEFRFPLWGSISARGLELELRQAIEPWHVLGEESAAGGTARYVDSSLERLQLKVRGCNDDRYVVACNGRRVPLFPTGVSGEWVAGIRFRAWQPPNALHPRIGVHAPLTFDVVDTWSRRSVAGCTYHVSHPGGLSFDQLPRNALEAESRRMARFFKIGHTPGPLNESVTHDSPVAPGAPLTLDLRRKP